MIMGNAATILSTKGIAVDITPPTFCHGSFSVSTAYTKDVCVPLLSDGETFVEVDIAIFILFYLTIYIKGIIRR